MRRKEIKGENSRRRKEEARTERGEKERSIEVVEKEEEESGWVMECEERARQRKTDRGRSQQETMEVKGEGGG